MNALRLGPNKVPTLIETAIQEYGARRVLWVAVVALLRGKHDRFWRVRADANQDWATV